MSIVALALGVWMMSLGAISSNSAVWALVLHNNLELVFVGLSGMVMFGILSSIGCWQGIGGLAEEIRYGEFTLR